MIHVKNILSTSIVLIITGTFFLFNCQKEIILPQLPYEARVSIQAVIEPDSVPIVYFNRTVPYLTGSTNTADLVIRNAAVTITTEGESDLLSLDSTYNKIDCSYSYFYKGTIKGKLNQTYVLKIEAAGKIYSGTTTTNLSAVSIDSVSYTPNFKDLYGEHEGVIAYFKDIANETNYYRYEMLREVDSTVRRGEKKLIGSCLANDTIMFLELGRSVYNDQNLENQQIKLVVEPALSHYKDLPGYVRIQSIDKNTFEFYDQIDKQKLGQYNPFVEPYFLRDGQFGKDAVGFFGSKIRSAPVKFLFPE